MKDRWWWRPIRDRWYVKVPANFLVACFLLIVVALTLASLLLSWNPWLLLFAMVVFPVWAWMREGR